MVGNIVSIRFVRQPLPHLGEMVLTLRIVDVGSQFGALAGEMTATAQYVARRPHLCRIDLRLRYHATAQSDGTRVGVNCIILRLASIKRFPIEGRA